MLCVDCSLRWVVVVVWACVSIVRIVVYDDADVDFVAAVALDVAASGCCACGCVCGCSYVCAVVCGGDGVGAVSFDVVVVGSDVVCLLVCLKVCVFVWLVCVIACRRV